MSASMAAVRGIRCELQPPRRVATDQPASGGVDQVRVVLQPRLCTLRSYASDGGGVIKRSSKERGGGGGGGRERMEELEMTPFLENLYEYIESSKRSHDFEIITGRLAMIVFAATVGAELATGNSVFKKMDMQGLEEGLGACLAAVSCAAAFAYSSSARKNVGRIFTVSCNAFIDALIDNIVDGLFYEESEQDDESNNENL